MDGTRARGGHVRRGSSSEAPPSAVRCTEGVAPTSLQASPQASLPSGSAVLEARPAVEGQHGLGRPERVVEPR